MKRQLTSLIVILLISALTAPQGNFFSTRDRKLRNWQLRTTLRPLSFIERYGIDREKNDITRAAKVNSTSSGGSGVSRRNFIRAAAASVAGIIVATLPGDSLIQPPNKLQHFTQAASPVKIGLTSFDLQLTEFEAQRLRSAYERTKEKIPLVEVADFLRSELDGMDEGTWNINYAHTSSEVARCPTAAVDGYFKIWLPHSIASLRFELERDKPGRVRYSGLLGSPDEFAVAFHELPDPLRSELCGLIGVIEPDRKVIANVHREWTRLARPWTDAGLRTGEVRPILSGEPYTKRFLSEDEKNKSITFGTGHYGVTTGRSEKYFLFSREIAVECIVCSLWDPETKTGGLTHFWYARDPELGLRRFLRDFQKAGGFLTPKTQIRLMGGSKGDSERLIIRLRDLLKGKGTIVQENLLNYYMSWGQYILDARTGEVSARSLSPTSHVKPVPAKGKSTQGSHAIIKHIEQNI